MSIPGWKHLGHRTFGTYFSSSVFLGGKLLSWSVFFGQVFWVTAFLYVWYVFVGDTKATNLARVSFGGQELPSAGFTHLTKFDGNNSDFLPTFWGIHHSGKRKHWRQCHLGVFKSFLNLPLPTSTSSVQLFQKLTPKMDNFQRWCFHKTTFSTTWNPMKPDETLWNHIKPHEIHNLVIKTSPLGFQVTSYSQQGSWMTIPFAV